MKGYSEIKRLSFLMKKGFLEMYEYKYKCFLLIFYVLFAMFCYPLIIKIKIGDIPYISFAVSEIVHLILFIILFIGVILTIVVIGKPLMAKKIDKEFIKIGLVNHSGEPPHLNRRIVDKHVSNGVVWEFVNNGVSIIDWQNKIEKIESVLNKKVYSIEYSKNSKRKVCIGLLPIKYDCPVLISPNDAFLSNIINCLVVGATGTGKSYCMRIILGKVARYIPNVSITIADYKKSSFSVFEETPNFYGYEECVKCINDFYEEFKLRLEANNDELNKKIRILLIDEYSALLASQDKKSSDNIKNMIGSMLFMGRSLGIRLIIGVQRADSELFKAGARDQFRNIIALGNLSKEQKQMLFSDYKEKMNKVNGLGEGYLLIDGKGIERIKIAPIYDFEELDNDIREALLR